MCLLFYILDENPPPGGYRLVLVNNRDEFWKRPSQLATFWGDKENFISGLDREPGKEGGTWLGMSKDGKIGALLNILGETQPNKKGRGHLITNYLVSNKSAREYLEEVATLVNEYSGFHLVLLEAGTHTKCTAQYLTHAEACKQVEVRDLQNQEIQGFGNTIYETPWQKVLKGKAMLNEILKKYPSTEKKSELIKSLQDMMSSKAPCLPDPVLSEQWAVLNYPADILAQRSSLNVWNQSIEYGTRTTTVILIDSDSKCDYVEKSLVVPVDVDNPQTVTKAFSFKLS